MKNPPSKELLQAIAVTAELTGTEISEVAARVMADDLAMYPEEQVMGALVRCRKELRGRMSIADVISRLDDGRPGPDEAWAIVGPCLADEGATFVWNEEIKRAFSVCMPLAQDRVAARLAFRETYERAVREARDAGEPVRWTVSLGWRVQERTGPLLEAVRKGRLTIEHAKQLCPPESDMTPERLISMAKNVVEDKTKLVEERRRPPGYVYKPGERMDNGEFKVAI